MKKITLALATLSTLVLIGCGGGGGSSSSNGGTNSNGTAKDMYQIQKVGYTLNGSNLPSCDKAYSIASSTAKKDDDFGVLQCTWICGEYEGSRPITVQLTFTQDGKDGIWEFERDILITAPEQCHN